MTRIFTFIFIIGVSLIAVVIAILGVIVVSHKARKAKRGGAAGSDEPHDEGWRICKYCGTRNRGNQSKCGNCGASL